MQATEHYPGQTASNLWVGMKLSKYREMVKDPINTFQFWVLRSQVGMAEQLSFQGTHEQLKECAAANLHQVMAGVGPKKFKIFHKYVGCVCLVEERKKGDESRRERKLLLLVFSFEPAYKRQQDYTCPSFLLTLSGVGAMTSLNCYIFELPIISFMVFFCFILIFHFPSTK